MVIIPSDGKKKIVVALLLGAAIAWRIIWLAISVRHLPPSADESLAVLQARWIWDGARPLLFTGQPYGFPLESYLMAPGAQWLPPTALGARLIPFILGLADVFVALLILRRLAAWETAWPAALLILFPSAYLLMHQTAYALPGYHFLILGTGLCILLVLPRRRFSSSLLAGLCAGLGFCSQFLSLPIAVVLAVYLAFQTDGKRALIATSGFALGVAAGLLPYGLSEWMFVGAHDVISGRHPFLSGLARIWNPGIRHTLPAALGWEPPVFPDNRTLILWPGGQWVALGIWLGGVLIATGWRGVQAVKRWRATGVLSLGANDIFVGISALSLLLFAFSTRADMRSYRYLLPVVWCWPFIAGYVYARAARWGRWVVGIAISFMLGMHALTAIVLLRQWQTPEFAADAAHIPDLQPALKWLQSNGIRHAVASYGAAYRINFESAEQIVCAQSVNERFPGWPIPYKETVDAASNVAYVLTSRIRFLKPEVFERHLRTMGVTAEKEILGDFAIYHHFHTPNAPSAGQVPRSELQMTASHNQAATWKLADGLRHRRWTSYAVQKQGMWIEMRLARPRLVTGLALCYGGAYRDRALKLNVLAATPGGWTAVAKHVAPALDKFEFRNSHPVYGADIQTLSWPEVQTDRLRLEIAEPIPSRAWTLGEIELHARAADD
jgi:hypothetical protein